MYVSEIRNVKLGLEIPVAFGNETCLLLYKKYFNPF
jgi:hypothetical protein